ncbi:MAG: DUF4190 and DUF4352 domain-containing protein [Acetatifactor sp.]|nr:DUF4190 and DUF4352 domain-containing protein [Acetatifactor sp.]
MKTQMKESGFGIAALVLGIIGLLTSCFLVGILPAALGLIFAIVALASKNRKHGTAVGGLVCSIIAIVIFIFVIVVAALGSGSDDDGAQKVGTVEQNNDSKQEDVRQEEVSPEETKQEETSREEASQESEDGFIVGDVVETSDLRISFFSAGEYVEDNQFLQPSEGNVYYRMEFEIENLSNSDKSISSLVGWNCYADDYAVSQSWMVGDDGLDASLSSGKKVKGAVYFEVPEDAESIVLEFEPNFWTSEKIVFIAK